MRAWPWIVLLAVPWALVAVPHPAAAAPQGGFGLSVGLAVHRSPVLFANNVSPHYTSLGASLAGDAQFVVDDRWSLDPYLLLSLEHTGRPQDATISNGAAGLELRRWWGERYLGLRAGAYVELLATAANVSTGYGPGLGLALGGEGADGRTWGLSLDLLRVGTFAAVHAGLRLHMGWRWGAS